ncbi:LysR family transcriptional regulator [Pseudorhodoferax sp.]|uniref:LysR family transcriptional regulator n=1 Tax=Pseudorhodoferax sp. TaxID=1993553 RepID=UPI002DD67868|nr:LysR family transcriptional regulator [Pseudorhodoferax sp.]
MNVSLRQLRAFGAVARLGSFTRAAQQLHITQAGLSGMIRELETQLDTRLFDRTTRAVSLTTAGQHLLPVAEQTLEQLESSFASLGRQAALARRTLTVGATPLVASCVLPTVIRRFAQQQPDLTVRLRDIERDQIQAQVEAGELDAGFGVFLSSAVGIQRVPLLKLPLLLASPADSGLPASVPWKMLRPLPLLALPVGNPVQRLIDDQLAAIGRANEERPEFNNFHTLLAMVEAGLGHAVLPSFAQLSGPRYRVRFTALSQPRVSLDFFQITKKGRELNPLLAAFSSTLSDRLG